MKEGRHFESESTERESTADEIQRAAELLSLQDAVANEETIGDSVHEESKWLKFLGRSDVQRFIDDGLVTIQAVHNKNGGFETVEVRDYRGHVVFYSSNKDFEESVKRFYNLDKIN